MRSDDHCVVDLGLQQERTTLSWGRTGFSTAVAGALLMRARTRRLVDERTWRVVILLGAVLVLAGWRRYHHLRSGPKAVVATTAIRCVTTCAVVTASAAFVDIATT